MPMLTFLLERQGWTEIMIHYVMSSSVSGCLFTQSHEGRVTENRGLLCILPLQRIHTDCVHVCVHTHVQLFDPMDCSPPGSSVHGIFQARLLEQVAISCSRGSSWPRDGSNLHFLSSCIGRQILYLFAIWEALIQTAAAAKSLQSCPTLCDPIDGSPPGSPVPGMLQARTLEWVAISFSNAWKWKVKVKSLSCVHGDLNAKEIQKRGYVHTYTGFTLL